MFAPPTRAAHETSVLPPREWPEIGKLTERETPYATRQLIRSRTQGPG